MHFSLDYYTIGYELKGGFSAWLQSQGETLENIGRHAGIADTSQLMAINPKLIRMDKLAPGGDVKLTGVSGNPARSNVAYGKKELDLKIDAAVAQIPASMSSRIPSSR